MTNYEKVIQIDNIVDILYDTSKYDSEVCPRDLTCNWSDIERGEKACKECIKTWLESEENNGCSK